MTIVHFLFSNRVLSSLWHHLTSMILKFGNVTIKAYKLAFHKTKVMATIKFKAPLGAFVSRIFLFTFIYQIVVNSLLVEPIKLLIEILNIALSHKKMSNQTFQENVSAVFVKILS